ncbi:MAG: PadR family transcriptional regulator [Nanoarchaeota archaeon]|nr:PadR family transcriptional regulator [Nanoarchaeota archaeon]MBU1269202.1 PadR family transcriptional regulator [Nanoarchaeota archaeon]MBU1605038.1 PadR family transcriptional regulator [Nanoarchaeota archaeon]MBU2442875.1 PadR family transcriptional regulator [Nanoarchaeota archaeon]
MVAVKVNSMVKLHTLCLLNSGPKHGYEIIKELENTMDQKISASHVYPFLKSLESNKLINCQKVELRDKKKYVLTKNGEEFINLIFDSIGHIMNSVIEKKVLTCAGCGCKIYQGSYQNVKSDLKENFCCIHCADASREKRVILHSWQIQGPLKTVSKSL